MILDAILVAIVAIITWCVASEGAWGAAIMLVNVIIAGLLATCLFEVTANFLGQNVASSYEWQHRWDVIAMVGLFSAIIFALRTATEYLMPVHVEVNGLVYDVARWGCSFFTGCVTMAFLLTALHTAPLPADLIGFASEPYRRGGPVGQSAPDMKWLGFVHHMTETAFNSGPTGAIFDGPRFELFPGGGAAILPTFPIRYASRRERYFGAAPAAAAPATTPSPGASGGGSNRAAGPPRF